ncbi:hypothetical protein Tco_0245404 [Tanacetum coccineum]
MVKYLRKVARVLFNKITEEQWAQHEEATVSYADLRASIEGYYEENVNHKDQNDKVIDAARNSLDKNSIARGDLLNALNGVTETLKAIQDAVKEDLVLNKKDSSLQWNLFKSSTSIAWNLGPRISATERSQADIRTEVSSLRQDTLDIKSIMIDIYQTFKVFTKEPPSHTEGDTEDMETQDNDEDIVEKEQVSEEPKHDVPISTVKPNVTPEEDHIKKAEEEAKRLAMTKTEVIKIIQEEAENIGIDPKKVISAKAGEKFKKAQDAEMQVHKRQYTKNVKRKKARYELEHEIKSTWWLNAIEFSLFVLFVNNMVIKEPEYGIFFTDVFGDQAFQRWNDIHKVGVDSQVSYLVMASMIKTLENARFYLKLKKLIAKHLDQEKLQSKRVKLEAVGYMLD